MAKKNREKAETRSVSDGNMTFSLLRTWKKNDEAKIPDLIYLGTEKEFTLINNDTP
jgi:hypothetical protein